MSRIWPHADRDLSGLPEVRISYSEIMLASLDKQDLLVDLYFTYVHPALPVVNQPTFMRDYAAR